MFNFFSKSYNEFLVFNISSSKVVCLVLKFIEEEKKFQVLGIGKAAVANNSVRGSMIIDLPTVTESCEKAKQKALAIAGITCDQAIFGISGDMCFSLVTTVKLKRGRKDLITEKELDALYDKTLEAALDQVQSNIVDSTGLEDMAVDLLTSSVVYVNIDEVETTSPVGHKGETIEMALYTAYTPSFHSQTISQIAKNLKVKIITLAPQTYCLVKLLKQHISKKLNAVIIDIGHDNTDISIVFGGGIVVSKSMPIGDNHFIEELSLNLGVPKDRAAKMKQLYVDKKLTVAEQEVIQECMFEVLNIWLSGVELLFNEFPGVKTFASDLFLVGGPAKLSDLAEVLMINDWHKKIPFKDTINPHVVTLDKFLNIEDTTGLLDKYNDTLPVSLSSIFLEYKGY